jgi:transcriptional regulator with XRE-family HTH domain
MKPKAIVTLPKVDAILAELGENVKLARLRRRLSATQVSERAGITRTTLWSIENGASSVTMAAYAQVLFVLGLEKDLLKVGADDELGQRIQDTELLVKKRAPKK